MANWTLSDIRTKVRNTTGRPDSSMMDDNTLDNYINKYYQYVMPKELKIFWGYTYFQFFTKPNVDQYVGPTSSTSSFQTINPSVWCDGFPVDWYINPDLFFQDWPAQDTKQVIGTGDNINLSFSFSTSDFPIMKGSLYVTDGNQVAQDDGSGGFISPASGSINYITGSVSVTFATAPASGANITITFQTYQANRPQAIMYFKSGVLADSKQTTRDDQKYFVLRPVPDDVYLIKMQGIQIPQELTDSTDVPYRTDLGALIAFGASLEIFSDFNQMDQYDQTLVQYNRYKDISMQDTYEEYLYQRSVPTF